MSNKILGVDIGGVIIERAQSNGADTSFFSANYLSTPEVDRAADTIMEIGNSMIFSKIFLISKCSEAIAIKTLQWIEHKDFFRRAGLSPESVFFCRERRQKAGICADLGVTDFIDDRLEVLGYLMNLERRILFRPDNDEIEQNIETLPLVSVANSWLDVREILYSTLV